MYEESYVGMTDHRVANFRLTRKSIQDLLGGIESKKMCELYTYITHIVKHRHRRASTQWTSCG